MFYGVYIDMHTRRLEEEKILKDWKQAADLAKFELSYSKRALIPLGGMLITFSFLMIYAAPQLVESSFYDLFFLIFIGMAGSWAKPKEFQFNKLKDGSWGTPYFLMLQQLPIRKEVLIKNRFVIYFVYSIPSNLLFLVSIYAFSAEIRSILTFSEYTVFTIIWLSFTVYWGTQFPLADVGELSNIHPVKVWFYTVAFLVMSVGTIVLIQLFTGYGVVYNTMLLAKKWPILTSLLSIAFAIVCTKWALRRAYQKMMKIDY